MEAGTSPSRKKKRVAITDQQRKATRSWAREQEKKPRLADCVVWFERQFNHKIPPSTVSSILSDRYNYLDTAQAGVGKRQRSAKWARLEDTLYEWHQSVVQSGGTVDGNLLQEKAAELWHQFPEYRNNPKPSFSSGWLCRFRERYALTKGPRSVPESAHEEIKFIRSLCQEYTPDNIYNVDEAGLLWRLVPYAAPQFSSVSDFDKRSRVCLLTCTNCSGTDLLPLWVIGHVPTPKALRNVNLSALNCFWRHNQRAWIDAAIMSEWLQFFYRHVGDRKVLLILDNFWAHEKGVSAARPPANVRIEYLPKYSTKIYQPMEQGVTSCLKECYRREWLLYIAAKMAQNRDPARTVDLHQAIRWLTQVWRHRVTTSVITSAWEKSTLSMKDPLSPLLPSQQQLQPQLHPQPLGPEALLTQAFALTQGQQQQQQQDQQQQQQQHHQQQEESMQIAGAYQAVERTSAMRGVRAVMGLEDFLHPPTEDNVDHFYSNEAISLQELELLDNALDEIERPVPSITQAIMGIQTALACAEHMQGITVQEIKQLEDVERVFKRIHKYHLQNANTTPNFG